MTQPQQRCDIIVSIDTQSDSAVSESVDTLQHVAVSHPLQPSVVNSDIVSHSEDIVTDATALTQHVQDNDLDEPSSEAALDDAVYHDCINASFTGKLLLFSTVTVQIL